MSAPPDSPARAAQDRRTFPESYPKAARTLQKWNKSEKGVMDTVLRAWLESRPDQADHGRKGAAWDEIIEQVALAHEMKVTLITLKNFIAKSVNDYTKRTETMEEELDSGQHDKEDLSETDRMLQKVKNAIDDKGRDVARTKEEKAKATTERANVKNAGDSLAAKALGKSNADGKNKKEHRAAESELDNLDSDDENAPIALDDDDEEGGAVVARKKQKIVEMVSLMQEYMSHTAEFRQRDMDLREKLYDLDKRRLVVQEKAEDRQQKLLDIEIAERRANAQMQRALAEAILKK